jgi:hypothetical protein
MRKKLVDPAATAWHPWSSAGTPPPVGMSTGCLFVEIPGSPSFLWSPLSWLFVGGMYTIPMLISRGMMGYCLISVIIELRQFTEPNKFDIRSVHNQTVVQEFTMNSPVDN